MTDIPIDLIDEPARPAREPGRPDEALRRSMDAIGLLQPVLLRPEGNRYVLVAGARRLAAARALHWTHIAAHIETLDERTEVAAAAAENMVREPMPPVDQWRAMRALMERGATIEHAAAALGLSLRGARRLDRLSRLDPAIIDLVRRWGLPDDEDLGTIAMAPLEVQREAVRAYGEIDDDEEWYRVAGACNVQRIPAARAIFDVAGSGLVFEDDLFASPDDPEGASYTTDVAGFVAAQQAALEAHAAAERAAGRRMQVVEPDRFQRPTLPKTYVEAGGNVDKPTKAQTVFCTVAAAGFHLGTVVRMLGVPAKKDAAKSTPQGASSTDNAADDAVADGVADDPLPAAPGRSPINGDGWLAIREARTRAVRDALIQQADSMSALKLLALFVLAVAGNHVRVGSTNGYAPVDFNDLCARLVPPEGAAGLDTSPDVRAVAAEAISRMVIAPTDGASDDAFEWIGHAIGADDLLPRFDTPAFFRYVSKAELEHLARAAGMKPAKTVAGLTQQLDGNLPDWRPCTFGAPGPVDATREAA